MKHYKVVLYTILGLLLGFCFFQAGIWYGELRHGHDSNGNSQIISPDQFTVILSLSEYASFELIDSSSRKQYLIFADQATGIVSFLEKRIEDHYYLTSWNTYRDGEIKDAVFNGTVLLYRGQGEFVGYRGYNDQRTALYGRDLINLINSINKKTRKAISLLPN